MTDNDGFTRDGPGAAESRPLLEEDATGTVPAMTASPPVTPPPHTTPTTAPESLPGTPGTTGTPGLADALPTRGAQPATSTTATSASAASREPQATHSTSSSPTTTVTPQEKSIIASHKFDNNREPTSIAHHVAHSTYDTDDPNDQTRPSQFLHSHRQSHSASKLPTFRFADRLIAKRASTPSLVPRGPPSPVSPDSAACDDLSRFPTHNFDAVDAVVAFSSTTHPGATCIPSGLPASSPQSVECANPASTPTTNPSSTQHSCASSTTENTSPDYPTRHKRPASLPDSASHTDASPTVAVTVATTPSAQQPRIVSHERFQQSRRPLTLRSASEGATTDSYLAFRGRQRIFAASTDKKSPEGVSGQRELLLPKTLSQTSPSLDRRDSGSNRPPVSYKPPLNSAAQSGPSTPVRVAPIRAFRSSISRKSLNLDMNFSRPFDFPGEEDDPNHDNSLSALEGRRTIRQPQSTPSSAMKDDKGGDDEGDMFLRIARQESGRRPKENQQEDPPSSVARVRASHRRPLSTNVASYRATSPPQLARRLSDQQDTTRSRRYLDDRATEVGVSSAYRAALREKAASAHPGDDSSRSRLAYTSQRPSAYTPRSATALQDSTTDQTNHARRRSSVNDGNGSSYPRASASKTYIGQGTKNYSSSPLVRSFDLSSQQGLERGTGMEGTESSLSTAAPSTVWDELDEMRSRINRLELTGKLPSTSGAAVSRVSDDRPPTATTTVTTMSSSPKRQGTGAQAHTEVASTTSSQREVNHPVLHTALIRSKPYISADIFAALEHAANDAMALTSMMGSSGQPGPISSGTSNIGAGTSITDRQLRRKADSVCRSLTDLCIALSEDKRPAKTAPAPQSVAAAQTDGSLTPAARESFETVAPHRRPSLPVQPSQPKAPTSPKSLSKFEERRQNLLSGSVLPSPRTTGSAPATPQEPTPSRRSSLLISRTRRGGTEELEDGRVSSLLPRNRRAGTEELDDGRVSSLLARNRRAVTEEPEEGRKTSFLVRNRRGTLGDDEVESRFRAPSRAITEVNTARNAARDYSQQKQQQQQQHPQPQEEMTSPTYTTALPRRRLPTAINTSRLATPTAIATPPARRFLERSIPAGDGPSYHDSPSDKRSYRISTIGQSSIPARTASLNTNRRHDRDSTITSISTVATAGAGYN